MIIPIGHVVELGLIRKRDRCAKCEKKMDVVGYNIQLCHSCRRKYLSNYVLSEPNNGIIVIDEAGTYPKEFFKHPKRKIAHNGKEALILLKNAKKGDTIIWDERTPRRFIHREFTK